jgi:ABC-type phosphate transport system substrate-binding protein
MKKTLFVLVLGQLLLASVARADEIVVIGNPAAATPLTKEQAADLFLGKSPGMKLIDQPASAPIKAAFYQQVSGHDLSQVKATWSRLIFTGKAQPPKELADSAAVKKAVAADPKTIGYIEKSAVDGTVKVVLDLK